MKLGIIITSLALALVTGCAAEQEETQAPQQEQQKEESKDSNETHVKVEASQTNPQMMCKAWGYIDAKRVCLY